MEALSIFSHSIPVCTVWALLVCFSEYRAGEGIAYQWVAFLSSPMWNEFVCTYAVSFTWLNIRTTVHRDVLCEYETKTHTKYAPSAPFSFTTLSNRNPQTQGRRRSKHFGLFLVGFLVFYSDCAKFSRNGKYCDIFSLDDPALAFFWLVL